MDINRKIAPKRYDFKSVENISSDQLQQHYKLYIGYINKFNEINSESRNASDYPDSNPTYSKMRCLKLGESYALDGVKLHELYFENLTNHSCCASKELMALINRDFINYDNFIEYFKNAALAMRGWVILTIDPLTDSLLVIGCDAHDVGAIWNSYPLLVLDVYEHAYMIDFGIDRKAYINAFIKNINWNVVNKRLQQYLNMKNSQMQMRKYQ
ncbi:superoxide dismutase [Clostridium polynesiense]|uniref:superoxide dismutase n=1 Tax=Clostridium polynesiense TaxID=1325933 RepID=UPI00058AD76A|nr:superoxide dismutase [Clostridium polynesiense]